MRKLLNIIQEAPLGSDMVPHVGDPKFVTAEQLVDKGIKKGYDKYFNTRGRDPLLIQKGTPIKTKWFENTTIEITPIRFRVQLSDTNPVGLLMDIIPMLSGRTKTGQMDLLKNVDRLEPTPQSQAEPTPQSQAEPRQAELPLGESDYSFLRTPLWEQDQNDLPLFRGVDPDSPQDISTEQSVEHPLIIVSKNMPGKNLGDLHRKAYILEFIGRFTGANTRLINMTGNDPQYLKAVADKHGMIYNQTQT